MRKRGRQIRWSAIVAGFRRLGDDESGAVTAEYVLVAAALALGLSGMVAGFGRLAAMYLDKVAQSVLPDAPWLPVLW